MTTRSRRGLAFFLAFLSPHCVHGATSIAPGQMELYPTWSAVGIELPYKGDENDNPQAGFA